MPEPTATEPALPRPVGSAENAEKFSRLPGGFFYYMAAFAEGILFLMFLLGRSPPERYAALGVMVAVLIALLWYYDRSNRQTMDFERDKLRAAAAPESMTRDPVPAEPRPGIIIAPDGTFVYGKPPPNWRVTTPTFLEQATLELGQQSLGKVDDDTMLPFRPGRVVCFTEANPIRIEYQPGKTMANGRPAVGGLLDETGANQVVMFSVSKFGAMFRDMPPEHIFIQLVYSLTISGALIERVREADSEVAGRRTLSAQATKRFAHVLVNGRETDELVVDLRLYVVEHENFVYVIQTMLIEGAPDTDLQRSQIAAIVESFGAGSAANAAERETEDRKAADADFDHIWSQNAWVVLVKKAYELMQTMRSPDGVIRVSPQQLENASTLHDYATAFPQYVPEEIAGQLGDFRDAVQAAHDGDAKPLAALLAEIEEQVADAAALSEADAAALPEPPAAPPEA